MKEHEQKIGHDEVNQITVWIEGGIITIHQLSDWGHQFILLEKHEVKELIKYLTENS